MYTLSLHIYVTQVSFSRISSLTSVIWMTLEMIKSDQKKMVSVEGKVTQFLC